MTRVAYLAAVLSVACICFLGGLTAESKIASAQDAAPAVKSKAQGRLPKFYSQVISGLQKEEIYKIQEGYTAKIDALEAQLLALKRERDAKVAAVLTPEQKQRVQEYEQAELNERQQELKSAAGTSAGAKSAPAETTDTQEK